MATASLLAKLIREGVPESTAKRAAERAAAQQRAAEGGFSDEVFYHASKQDIDEFVPGYDDGLTFLTDNSSFANNWLGKGRYQGRLGADDELKALKKQQSNQRNSFYDYDKLDEIEKRTGRENGKMSQEWLNAINKMDANWATARGKDVSADDAYSAIYPVNTKVQKTFDPRNDYKKIEPFLKNHLSAENQEIITKGLHKEGNWVVYENKAVVDELKNMGYDSMRIKESANPGAAHETLAVFNPKDIRSVNAQFDPAKRDSANLLASAAGAGVLGAAALAPQEAEARMISSLQALREGEIKAPKNAKTAQLATAIRAGERAVKGSPAEFVYPSSLAPWLERIAYDEEPTKMETVMAIADFL